jgi:hypothetical protein
MDLKTAINEVIPNSAKLQLKELLAKFEDAVPTEPAPAVTEPMPVAVEVKTKDGLIFTAEALEVGKEIKQITDGGVIDVLDNTYEMETGEVVTVTGGVIAEIVAAPTVEEVAPVEVINPEVSELKQTVARLTEMVANMSAQLKEQHNAIKVTLSAVNSIVSQPAGEPKQKPNILFGIKSKQIENLNKINKNK